MIVILTDGSEIFAERIIESEDELESLNKNAFDATDGNLYWVIKPLD